MQKVVKTASRRLAATGIAQSGLPVRSDSNSPPPVDRDLTSSPEQNEDWFLLDEDSRPKIVMEFDENRRPKIILPGNSMVDLINVAGRLTSKFASEMQKEKDIEEGRLHSEQFRGEVAAKKAAEAVSDPNSLMEFVSIDSIPDVESGIESVEMSEIKTKLPKANHKTLKRIVTVLNENDAPEIKSTSVPAAPPSIPGPSVSSRPSPPLAADEGKTNGKQQGNSWNYLLYGTAATAAVIALAIFFPEAAQWLLSNLSAWMPNLSAWMPSF